jgi:TRAP-type C4-dicarboxylate transport system substrate-binding protein
MYKKGMLRGYDGIIVCALNGQPPYHIHTNFPVRKPEDIKGKKFRTGSSKLQHDLLVACGGTPVAIRVNKIAEVVSRGLVQGTISEWDAMKIFRVNDVCKYHCMVSFGCNTMMQAMNKEKYESLPAEAKAVLDKHMGEPFVQIFAEGWGNSAKSIHEEVEKDPQHSIYIPTDAEMKMWKARMDPVIEAWKKENPRGEDLIRAYKEGVAEFRRRGK